MVTRHDHPLQADPVRALPALVEQPWVIPVVGTWLRQELEELLASKGLGLPSNRVECTSYLTLHRLIVTTDAIGLLPTLVVAEAAGCGRWPRSASSARPSASPAWRLAPSRRPPPNCWAPDPARAAPGVRHLIESGCRPHPRLHPAP